MLTHFSGGSLSSPLQADVLLQRNRLEETSWGAGVATVAICILPMCQSTGATMSEQSLNALLHTLRSELARADDLDADARDALHSLLRELEVALQRSPEGSNGMEPALRDRLADWMRELEVSHPKLSSTVSNIVDVLAFYNL
jgi:hypothetical protein